MFNLSFSQPIIPQLLKNRVRFVKETPGYKGIAVAVLRTSGVKLSANSGLVQSINRRLEDGAPVVYRQTGMILVGDKIVATNNKDVRLAFDRQGYTIEK